jgi:hypothetical protein
MTHIVISFQDGAGRLYCVLLHRVSPNAYGGGGSPLLCHFMRFRPVTPGPRHQSASSLSNILLPSNGSCGKKLSSRRKDRASISNLGCLISARASSVDRPDLSPDNRVGRGCKHHWYEPLPGTGLVA